MSSPLTGLRVFFRDEDLADVLLPLEKAGTGEFYSLGSEQDLTLPNGEVITVYAEVGLDGGVPDILLTIIQGGRDLDIRCGSGVIVSYETEGHLDVLLQVGTGAWE